MTSTTNEKTFKVFTGSPNSSPSIKTASHRAPGPREALVKITHSGVCGTDLHYAGAPMGLGHEVVGTVTQLGAHASAISDLKIGDRVGLGWMQKVCLHCDECLAGEVFRCKEAVCFGAEGSDMKQGGLGEEGCWDVSCLFRVPEGGMHPGDRVGVVGVGGLGHLAIQYGSKMGYEMVVFSGTESKKAEALNFGAAEFYATQGVSKFEGVKPIDHLLITTSVLPDLNLFAPIFKTGAKIFPLTISMEPLQVPMMPLISTGLKIIGSAGARFWSLRTMLEFSAKHGVKPQIEKFDFTDEGVNGAIEKLKDGKMRYRGVVVVA
ncbi:NADP-dependent alcohol dehydrogenase C 2 [Cyphellophora attinorum]|uniref:NADP-dependent alcohol dehydrogenase C 2 n=1 Tax=Cyphellophora attinorum TaxID=1664694 RepID=A0A0N1H7S2_9EURO|nr:NADP-dependent alcohol dehydrogenase C 2 [Phialophora attinorum]KPI37733.1 NADP-dependent alcohol dehydrogenase C 2 [Phialophora attinorum]